MAMHVLSRVHLRALLCLDPCACGGAPTLEGAAWACGWQHVHCAGRTRSETKTQVSVGLLDGA